VKYDEIIALQAPNIHVIQGSMRTVDPESKTVVVAPHGTTETTELPYDYFVAATGLRRVWPVVPQSLRRKQYLFETGDHIRNVTNARHDIAVVGGGT
jgi:NADH dehydrogenase FAD-containing subunit